jgi:iron complex transport system permease protein
VSEFLAWTRPRRLTAARLAAILGACAAVTALVALIAPLFGTDRGADDSWHLTFMDPRAAFRSGTLDFDKLWIARMPRVLAGLIVGAALAGAGCTFQATLRNPLAEPFTLGISSGASLAAVAAIHFGFAGALGGAAIGLAAVVGAAASVLFVWRLGRVGASLPPATLLLAGVTLAMFCSAGSMLLQYTSDFEQIGAILHWMMGSFDEVGYRDLERAGPAIGVGLVVLLALARDLNALAAGDEAAASVGVAAGRAQAIAFATGSLLVGASIAIAGPIGFVGLIVPHGLRAIVGPDHRALLPASMLIGGALLVVCDTIAQFAMLPQHLAVGIVTALIGGPFFLFILVRAKRGAALWGGS